MVVVAYLIRDLGKRYDGFLCINIICCCCMAASQPCQPTCVIDALLDTGSGSVGPTKGATDGLQIHRNLRGI